MVCPITLELRTKITRLDDRNSGESTDFWSLIMTLRGMLLKHDKKEQGERVMQQQPEYD